MYCLHSHLVHNAFWRARVPHCKKKSQSSITVNVCCVNKFVAMCVYVCVRVLLSCVFEWIENIFVVCAEQRDRTSESMSKVCPSIIYWLNVQVAHFHRCSLSQHIHFWWKSKIFEFIMSNCLIYHRLKNRIDEHFRLTCNRNHEITMFKKENP